MLREAEACHQTQFLPKNIFAAFWEEPCSSSLVRDFHIEFEMKEGHRISAIPWPSSARAVKCVVYPALRNSLPRSAAAAVSCTSNSPARTASINVSMIFGSAASSPASMAFLSFANSMDLPA